MIRSLILVAALGGLALVSTQSGFGQATRFYIKGGIGPALTEDTRLKEFNGPITDTKVKFDPGVQFRFAGGFRITEWLSTELESGVTYNNIKSITGATTVDASLSNVPLLANLVLQCPPKKCPFTPYVGGGFGYSSSVLDAEDINIGGLHLSDTQSDAVFAYHAFGGFAYHINDRMHVDLAYRYFGTTEPTWKSDVIFAGGSGRTRFGENRTHSITFSFTYSF